MNFTYDMLPNLGTRSHIFYSEKTAARFAAWAIRVSKEWRHPCRASLRVDSPRRWEVLVSNW